MPNETRTIVATTTSFASEQLEALRNFGLRVVLNPLRRKLQVEELIGLLDEFHPVGLLAGTESIPRAVLEKAKSYLRVISRVGAGWDNVDRAAAVEMGMRVYRTSGVLTQAVAELTVGLMLSALRHIALQDRMMRQGIWKKRMGFLLQGKVVGIVGFGAIGRRVGELAKAFGAEVIYYDPQPATVDWAKSASLPQLLQQADIVSLHASGKERILGWEEIHSLMARGAILVNTARGELIDEEALCASFKAGNPGYACLDVFWEEPSHGPLCHEDHVILTPHIGSYARESRLLMEETAVANLVVGLREAGIL